MKKIALFIVLLVLSIIQMVAQDTSIKGTITLSHQGRTTDFAYNKMADVVESAVDGDTVYLSSGYFEGDFIIDKKLSFIGSGAYYNDYRLRDCSLYYGKIILKLPENSKLTACLFEGIYFRNTFTFNTTIENVVFKKCRWDNSFDTNADILSILIDRCYAYFWNANARIKKIVARNCYFNGFCLRNDKEYSQQIFNCNISQSGWCANEDCTRLYGNLQNGTYTNCIFLNKYNEEKANYIGNIDGTEENAPILTNCLFYTEDEIVTTLNCKTVNCYTVKLPNNSNIENLTKEELIANNFLGTDGTVVGYYGGKNPYTLKQTSSTITSSKVHFDKDNKQIQIKMKVSSEQ